MQSLRAEEKSVEFTLSIAVHTGGMAKIYFSSRPRKKGIGEQINYF